MKLTIELESKFEDGRYHHSITSTLGYVSIAREEDRKEVDYLLEVADKCQEVAKSLVKETSTNEHK